MIVAIIPARGGSKRIPGKNIRPLGGQPIITYPIETALKSGLFNRVIVSTDSNRIAEIAREAGADVPFMRPKYLADDQTSTAEVLLHAVAWLKEKDHAPEYLCCLYPTAAFILMDDLVRGYNLLSEKKADIAFSVTTFDFSIFRALRLRSDGRMEMVWPEHELSRSNDLPELYHDAGQFYWMDVDSFLKRRKILSSNSIPVILPRNQVIDIDTEEDWAVAEHLWRILHGK